MQIKGLHKSIYRLYHYARTQECLDRYRIIYENGVKLWEKLKDDGASEALCRELSGLSRATYYRHKKILDDLKKGISPPTKRPKTLNKPKWGEAEMQLVLRIRRENPTYGKFKIAIILKRDHGATISESTVGRILSRLKEKGLINKSLSAIRGRKKRLFKGHAQRWTYKKYEEMVMGEKVQIDHMTVTKNSICVKHFQAWERKSHFIAANVYSNAKSSSAKKFLKEFVQNTPIKILSIQVDGGSEFMKEFEEACADLKIPLEVLPPAKPQYNGGVERGNRIFREEFYANPKLLADSLGAMRAELRAAVKKYNTYRPHFSLKGLTPIDYINSIILEAA